MKLRLFWKALSIYQRIFPHYHTKFTFLISNERIFILLYALDFIYLKMVN